MKKLDWLIIGLLLAFGIVLRLFGDIANFQPMIAVALFGGFYFANRILPLLLVGFILIFTDWYQGALGMISEQYPWQIFAVTYLSLMWPTLIGRWLDRQPASYLPFAGKVAGISLAVSLIFFAASNWAFWQFTTFYPHTLAGLGQTYLAGLPFLRSTLASGVGFSLLVFSSWYAVARSQMAWAHSLRKWWGLEQR